MRNFPGGPVVKNPPSNAGDETSIPGSGTKIPHATRKESPCTTTRESPHTSTRSLSTREAPALCNWRKPKLFNFFYFPHNIAHTEHL